MDPAKTPRHTRDNLDVACVLHGSGYDWIYVERLRNMVIRNINIPVTMHIWTEPQRSVPAHYVRHDLEEWPGIQGPKKSWWYKMQMFDPRHFCGDLLYFDLDVVICDDISGLVQGDTQRFWTVRDFRYLQNPNYNRMNSSIMWWNTQRWSQIWDQFQRLSPREAMQRYRGDQDFLEEAIDRDRRRYYPDTLLQSWRWSALDGGRDFRARRYRSPGAGTQIQPGVSVLIFHGKPKPHEIQDPVIRDLWR